MSFALGKLKVDTGKFSSELEVGYTNLAGQTLRMKYCEGKSHAAVEVDGKPVQSEEWSAVYDSPYVRAKDGVLTVNDGSEGYVVDFTGDMPVYKPW